MPTNCHSPAIAALIAAFVIALPGCGGTSGDATDTASQPAPSAASFPDPGSDSLDQLLAKSKITEDVVASPSEGVIQPGDSRFGFGLFTVDRKQISNAQAAIYIQAPGEKAASGPFPAKVENLATPPAFRAKTTADDPDAAQIVYVADVPFEVPGDYKLAALITQGSTTVAARIPGITVKRYPKIPAVGDGAPRVHTVTAAEAGNDIGSIDTRVPPSDLHADDLADVLGRKPVVLLFSTPALCQSRVCGPVVDVAEQVKSETDADVAFIHQEIYENNKPPKLRSQVKAYGLPTEPWLFVIDKTGKVSTRIEGAFSAAELKAALAKVT